VVICLWYISRNRYKIVINCSQLISFAIKVVKRHTIKLPYRLCWYLCLIHLRLTKNVIELILSIWSSICYFLSYFCDEIFWFCDCLVLCPYFFIKLTQFDIVRSDAILCLLLTEQDLARFIKLSFELEQRLNWIIFFGAFAIYSCAWVGLVARVSSDLGLVVKWIGWDDVAAHLLRQWDISVRSQI
jgi:hypothetical protein